VNCNPETVSTITTPPDKLYFEPLTVEDVLSIYDKENRRALSFDLAADPLNIAAELFKSGVKILGTSPETMTLRKTGAGSAT
jgi:carbamoyl-phosphate synthase large subunit